MRPRGVVGGNEAAEGPGRELGVKGEQEWTAEDLFGPAKELVGVAEAVAAPKDS